MHTQTLPAHEAAGPLARRLPPQGGFRLGPFMVDAEGLLTPSELPPAPAFRFHWRGRKLEAELSPGRLSVSVRLGRVPSTLGGAALRPSAFAMLRGLPGTLPPPWRLGLRPDHQVALTWSAPLAMPVSATGLITGLTRFLLDLRPYLDLLEDAGVAGGDETSAPEGTTSTCPG